MKTIAKIYCDFNTKFGLPRQSNLINEINASFRLCVLINNAGVGGSRRFMNSSIEYLENIIKLNIEATTLLTHQLLPNLIKCKRSYILNVSSMASCTPVGYKTVYPASKEYIRHFSRGLNEELKESGVSVTTAVLGPMPTTEDIRRRIEAQCTIGRLLTISTQQAAKVSIDAMLKGRTEVVVGLINKIGLKLLKLIPVGVSTRIATRTIKKELT